MAIVVKKVHGREYAYQAFRSREKVIQTYLGPVSSARVQRLVRQAKKVHEIPKEFYPLFWDTDPRKLDLKHHSRYIIERILELGTLKAFKWLQWIYPSRLIAETCRSSRRVSEKSGNFWLLWLGASRDA